jgi:putative oligomerization/nucleic acid binding protein
MGRTAVVAGTATAVSNRVSRRQANRWSQQDAYSPEPAPQPQYVQQPVYAAPPPPPPPAPVAPDPIEQLKQLAQLRDAGVLTEEEFTTQKARILA